MLVQRRQKPRGDEAANAPCCDTASKCWNKNLLAIHLQRHIYPAVCTGGKKRWSLICREENFHLLLGVTLWFCTSHQCSFLTSSWIPQVLSETDVSYMNDFNEISVHVGYDGSICTSDATSWTFDRCESNKAFQVGQPSHWCHIFGKPVGYGIVSRFLKPFESDRRQTSTIHKMVKYTESAESFGGSNNRSTITTVDQVHVHEEQTINSVFFQQHWKVNKRKTPEGCQLRVLVNACPLMHSSPTIVL